MSTKSDSLKGKLTENFSEFSQLSDYSFMNSLKADPQSTKDGNDHKPRSVYSCLLYTSPSPRDRG